MIDLAECILLGTISKTHGINGQVVLRTNNLRFDDILEMELVFLEIDGLPVPFFIAEFTERSNDSLVVKFDDIESEEAAKELIGSKVFIGESAIIASESSLPKMHSLTGYTVIDESLGELGILEDIIENSENPLLRITKGSREILLPLHDEFIKKVDSESSIIFVSSPEGLIDLD